MKKQTLDCLAKNLLKQIQYIQLFLIPFQIKTKERILDYLSGGKGVFPYEKIKSHEDLICVPENVFFFSKTEFYSSFKNEVTSDEEYKNIKNSGQFYS